MECGIIYLKIVPTSENYRWIKYCNLFRTIPDVLQLDILSILSRINKTYEEQLISPLYENVHPGCITIPDYVEVVANELYKRYDDLLFFLMDEHCVRCVYSIGDVVDPEKTVSIHHSRGEGLIKLGRYLDSVDNTGLYEI